MSFERRQVFRFLQIFFASNLTCEISAPMGARHKIFGPTCSVASPPTNDTFSFLKKVKGGSGDKLNWGDPQKNRFLSETDRKSFLFCFIFLNMSGKVVQNSFLHRTKQKILKSAEGVLRYKEFSKSGVKSKISQKLKKLISLFFSPQRYSMDFWTLFG